MELSDASKAKPFQESPKDIAFSLLSIAFLTAANQIGCVLFGSYEIISIVFITDSQIWDVVVCGLAWGREKTLSATSHLLTIVHKLRPALLSWSQHQCAIFATIVLVEYKISRNRTRKNCHVNLSHLHISQKNEVANQEVKALCTGCFQSLRNNVCWGQCTQDLSSYEFNFTLYPEDTQACSYMFLCDLACFWFALK